MTTMAVAGIVVDPGISRHVLVCPAAETARCQFLMSDSLFISGMSHGNF